MNADLLATELTTGEPARRLAAAEALSMLGPDASAASAALVQACAEPDLRDVCVGVLEELGPPPAGQLPHLASLLGSSDDELVLYWAATLIGRAGAESAPHADGLAALAANEGVALAARERAVWALGEIGPAAAPAAPLLRTLAESATAPRLRRLAGDSLVSVSG